MKTRRTWFGLTVAVAISVLYVVAFFLPTWKEPYPPVFKVNLGYQAFLFDYHNDKKHFALIPWLANPLVWVGLLTLALGKNIGAILLGIMAFLAALTAIPGFVAYDFDAAEPLDGYFLWLLCPALLVVAGIANAVWSKFISPLPSSDQAK